MERLPPLRSVLRISLQSALKRWADKVTEGGTRGGVDLSVHVRTRPALNVPWEKTKGVDCDRSSGVRSNKPPLSVKSEAPPKFVQRNTTVVG